MLAVAGNEELLYFGGEALSTVVEIKVAQICRDLSVQCKFSKYCSGIQCYEKDSSANKSHAANEAQNEKEEQ